MPGVPVTLGWEVVGSEEEDDDEGKGKEGRAGEGKGGGGRDLRGAHNIMFEERERTGNSQ